MRCAHWLILACLIGGPAAAQVNLPAEITDEAALPRVMPRFATAVIAVQQAKQTDPASLFRAQLVAGLYRDALQSLDTLRAPLADNPSPRVRARYLEYVLYARSQLTAKETKTSFQTAYRKMFRVLIRPLDNPTSAMALNVLSSGDFSQASQALDRDLAQLKGRNSISLADSLKLLAAYNEREIDRAFGSTSAELIAADDAHRYTIDEDVMVALPKGGSVCALVIRPKGSVKMPALLQYTIYNDTVTLLRDARQSASNGYVGVIGLVRGKGCSSGAIVPYEHDGADAATLVEWIAAQGWSDGKVGMFGGSYSRAGAMITLIYALGLVLIWFAPETKGKPLPD
jgi:uncharacterized protein